MKRFASLAVAGAVVLIAGTASAQEARIGWGDLDLSRADGAAAFDARIDATARRLCRDVRRPGSRLSDRAFCQAAVRSEALRQLPSRAQVDYALARVRLSA